MGNASSKNASSSSSKWSVIKPYIMDLKSRHGTYLMGDKLEPHRFYELLAKDKIQFGRSTREYIVLAADLIQATNKSETQMNDEESAKKEANENEKYDVWSDDD